MKRNNILTNLIKEPKVIIALSCVVLILMVALAIVAIDTLETARIVPNDGKDAAEIIANGNLTLKNDYGKQKISASYAELESNYEEWKSADKGLSNGVFCITTDSASNIVYNIDSNNVAAEGKTFSDYNYMWIDSGCTDFYAVLNISGKNIKLSDYYILTRDETGIYGSRTLLNFYEAESVDVSGSTIIGNILAPYAIVNCNDSSLYGQINSKEIFGKLAFQKDLPFAGYKQITSDFESITFRNDVVRIAAIEYLINNDFENKYTNYTTTSTFKLVDTTEVKKIAIYANGLTLNSIEDDLAMFPNLQEVIIKGADLKEFSTEKIPDIKVLTIAETNIQTLNITDATSLQKLVIDDNHKLENFNYTKGNNIKILSYANTPLGWLEFADFPQLTYLDCSGAGVQENLTVSGEKLNNLKMLDISNNSNIMTVYLNTFPKLESINCSDCPISSLDFNNCNNLKYFKGSNISISDFDFKPAKLLSQIEVFGENVKKVDVTDLVISAIFYDRQVELVGIKMPEEAPMGGIIVTGALVNGQIVNGIMVDGKIIYDTSGNDVSEDQIVTGALVNGQIVNGIMVNGQIIYENANGGNTKNDNELDSNKENDNDVNENTENKENTEEKEVQNHE